MLKPQRRPTAPGEILREHYLKPRGLSVAELARAVEHSYKHVSQIVNGKAAIEARLACKLAAIFGTTLDLWLNLQKAVDLWEAHQELAGWQPATTYLAPVETGD
jgi:addiction module HigA family antidote